MHHGKNAIGSLVKKNQLLNFELMQASYETAATVKETITTPFYV